MTSSPTIIDVTSDTESDSEHALQGKIARLPDEIREQLNQRLFNGEGGPQVLPWLNELPIVKQILVSQFDGVAISDQNLSNWRKSGYKRWSLQKQNVGLVKDLNQFVADLTQAGVDGLTPATAGLASAKILEYLEALDPATTNPGDLAKCATAIAILRDKEQNEARIKIAKERLGLRYMALRIKRDIHQRDVVAIAKRVLGDARAKAIEAAPWNNAEIIEGLGIHIFGQLWEPRLVPVQGDSSGSSNQPKLA
jgi:hypothetical protein